MGQNTNKMTTRSRARRQSQLESSTIVLTRARSTTRTQTNAERTPYPAAGPRSFFSNPSDRDGLSHILKIDISGLAEKIMGVRNRSGLNLADVRNRLDDQVDASMENKEPVNMKRCLAEWNKKVVQLVKACLIFLLVFGFLTWLSELLRQDILPASLFSFKHGNEVLNLPDPFTICISAISVLNLPDPFTICIS